MDGEIALGLRCMKIKVKNATTRTEKEKDR